MPTDLPPLAAIRAFEAAARHSSFTAAADELGMTQAAVSYQIKVLEDRVGIPVFLRHARGVELTETGRRLMRPAAEALNLLRDGFAEARERSQDMLSISVLPTFATNILAQRLGRFQIANPTIAVRLDVSQTPVNFDTEDFDAAIRSGYGEWPGLVNHQLMHGIFTPMLSPQLAKTIGGVDEPSDLLKLPILERNDPWWRQWFEAAGLRVDNLVKRQTLQFGSQVLEANAAIAGQGVAILTPAFYGDAVAQGQLYQPFDLTCDDGQAYWLVYPENRRNASSIRAFRQWICAEMAEFN